jgi:beta-xylosidase
MIVRSARTQVEPVYAGYFADPFVWKAGNRYYAVGTGEEEASGRTARMQKVFPLLTSNDLCQWEYVGRALERPDESLGMNFWAPAVAVFNDRFYLYYSVGHGDKGHQLRVATAGRPEGLYKDLEQPLIDPAKCSFAIDPHPFQDNDGTWYLFFARDFLDEEGGARAGTALVGARMKSMTELADEPQIILRARHDWQRFEKDRLMYGRRWDWHTLEGPCVWKHGGNYYCFYSGGRWENETYGVDYGVASAVMGPYLDAGNERGPRVLKTAARRLIGPGHNTIVRGPDDDTDFIVYHAWDRGMTKRQMFISELRWTEEGPRVA